MSKPSNKKRTKQRERLKRKHRQKLGLPKLTRVQRVAKKIDKTWNAACDQAEREGFPLETVYAMRATGLTMTAQSIETGATSSEEMEAWRQAIAEYRAAHPEEQIVNQKGIRMIGHG